MFAVSSQVKLRCTASGDGGAPGCVGSLHTYAWSPPKTECGFREIRTVEGKIRKFDFLAEDGEIMIKSQELQCTHVVKTVGAAGGWITVIQGLVWIIQLLGHGGHVRGQGGESDGAEYVQKV